MDEQRDDTGDREVPDERLLLEFLLSPDPALFTSEIADNLPITRQRVGQLLDPLMEEGLVTSKYASGRRLYWLSPTGREYITAVARERFDED